MATTPQQLGKYKIVRLVGKGAMGVVYEGFDTVIERTVAIKTIRTDELDPAEAEEHSRRFLIEAKAAGKLNHPNIVGIYDYGNEQNLAYIVMEYVHGKELKSYFDAGHRFTLSQIVRIMGQLLEALGLAHARGIVHRDVKPANIFITEDGTVKLGDFGIARIDSTHKTHAGTILGTPSYMSPEQIQGESADARSDLYSAGVILYQFLTGEKPFAGSMVAVMHKVLNEEPPPPSSLNPQVSRALDQVVAKAMAKDPAARYGSAKEFAEALRVSASYDVDESEQTRVLDLRDIAGLGERTSAADITAHTTQNRRDPTASQLQRPLSVAESEIELEFWRSIKDSEDVADFEIYLKKYPQGHYAELAQLKIAKLRKDESASAATADTTASQTGAKALDEIRKKAEEARRRAEEEIRRAEEEVRRAEEAQRKAQAEAKQKIETALAELERSQTLIADTQQAADHAIAAGKVYEAAEVVRSKADAARRAFEHVRSGLQDVLTTRDLLSADLQTLAEEGLATVVKRVQAVEDVIQRFDAALNALVEKAQRQAETTLQAVHAIADVLRDAEHQTALATQSGGLGASAQRAREDIQKVEQLAAQARTQAESILQEKALLRPDTLAKLQTATAAIEHIFRKTGQLTHDIEEARRKAEEEARRKAEEEARRKAEEEARRKAEEEARRKAEEEARRKAEEEARRKAEEETRRKAEEEARRKAEEEARRKAEEEARRKAEEEARRKAEEEAARRLKTLTASLPDLQTQETGEATVAIPPLKAEGDLSPVIRPAPVSTPDAQPEPASGPTRTQRLLIPGIAGGALLLAAVAWWVLKPSAPPDAPPAPPVTASENAPKAAPPPPATVAVPNQTIEFPSAPTVSANEDEAILRDVENTAKALRETERQVLSAIQAGGLGANTDAVRNGIDRIIDRARHTRSQINAFLKEGSRLRPDTLARLQSAALETDQTIRKSEQLMRNLEAAARFSQEDVNRKAEALFQEVAAIAQALRTAEPQVATAIQAGGTGPNADRVRDSIDNVGARAKLARAQIDATLKDRARLRPETLGKLQTSAAETEQHIHRSEQLTHELEEAARKSQEDVRRKAEAVIQEVAAIAQVLRTAETQVATAIQAGGTGPSADRARDSIDNVGARAKLARAQIDATLKDRAQLRPETLAKLQTSAAETEQHIHRSEQLTHELEEAARKSQEDVRRKAEAVIQEVAAIAQVLRTAETQVATAIQAGGTGPSADRARDGLDKVGDRAKQARSQIDASLKDRARLRPDTLAKLQTAAAEMEQVIRKSEQLSRDLEEAKGKAGDSRKPPTVAETPKPPPVNPENLFQRARALEREGNFREAVKLYEEAGNAGHGPASLRLGEIYANGASGVRRDYVKSVTWFDRARQQGMNVDRSGS